MELSAGGTAAFPPVPMPAPALAPCQPAISASSVALRVLPKAVPLDRVIPPADRITRALIAAIF
jgi:hypothetical protein